MYGQQFCQKFKNRSFILQLWSAGILISRRKISSILTRWSFRLSEDPRILAGNSTGHIKEA